MEKKDCYSSVDNLEHSDIMFLVQIEKQEFGLKPMNCPGHCLMFQHRVRSYRGKFICLWFFYPCRFLLCFIVLDVPLLCLLTKMCKISLTHTFLSTTQLNVESWTKFPCLVVKKLLFVFNIRHFCCFCFILVLVYPFYQLVYTLLFVACLWELHCKKVVGPLKCQI